MSEALAASVERLLLPVWGRETLWSAGLIHQPPKSASTNMCSDAVCSELVCKHSLNFCFVLLAQEKQALSLFRQLSANPPELQKGVQAQWWVVQGREAGFCPVSELLSPHLKCGNPCTPEMGWLTPHLHRVLDYLLV